MKLDEYQTLAKGTKVAEGLMYTGLALAGEAGEVAHEDFVVAAGLRIQHGWIGELVRCLVPQHTNLIDTQSRGRQERIDAASP